jgi:ribosomal protein S18 acetylase RimI-like enzyme
MADFEIVERLPTPDEHREMFQAVGWTPYTPAETEEALRNTRCGVVALNAGRVIAMGRVIGDGGKFYYIQDFAVRPEYQRQGVGQALMRHLLAYIRQAAPHEPFVGLFATDMGREFYRSFGFGERNEILTGMWLVMPADGS